MDKHYIVTCIGDSSPNGNCLGGIANAPNCNPNQKLIYTNKKEYKAEDGTTYILGGTYNGDKRADYRFYLPNEIPAQKYEEDHLKTFPVLVALEMNGIKQKTVKDFKTFYELTGYHSMTASALRTGDVLSLFDSDYSQEDALWNLPMSKIKRQEFAEAVENHAIDEADCIIFSVGSNDIFAGPIYEMSQAQCNKLKSLFSGIRKGLETYRHNLPLIVNEIRKKNSKCRIVFVGSYNPIRNYSIHDLLKLLGHDTGIFFRILKIGNIANLLLNKISKEMRKISKQDENSTFVKINGIPVFTDRLLERNEIPTSQDEGAIKIHDVAVISSNPLANSIHPTEEGHAIIARKIISALK